MPQSNFGSTYSSYDSSVKGYSLYQYSLPQSYIYLYHTDEYFIIPQYPEHVSDTMDTSFGMQNALSRTAPVLSYNNSGPRSVLFDLKLHRDMMNDVNASGSNVQINGGSSSIGDDYIDILIKKLQSVSLPTYDGSSKLVTPPMVAVRFGQEIFIKGVVNTAISVNYDLPILENNKYAQVGLNFSVIEVQPYDANQVGNMGSFRGITSGLAAKMG